MEFAVHIFNTRTGNVVYPNLPYLGVPEFSRGLNSDGHIKVSVPLDDRSTPSKTDLRQMVAGWRFSLAVTIGDFVVAAGPIMTWNFNESQMSLDIGAGSVWAILNRRLIRGFGATTDSPMDMDPSQDAIVLGSKYDIARGLVLMAIDPLVGGADYSLPLIIPPFLGGASEYNYPIYDLASFGQRLRDLTQEEDGPDIDFDPVYLTATNLAYNVRIGNPALTQVGQDIIWTTDSSITDIDVDSDWSTVLTKSFVRGNSTERVTEVAVRSDDTLPDAGWPELEVVDSSHQSVTVFDTLQSYANENVRFFQRPIETWSMEVDTDSYPKAGTYKPGDTLRVNVLSHPWLEEGEYSHRLLGWTNGQGQRRLRLILEDTQGSI